ncbi:MAG: hypothetical protein GTN89_07250, partial [Acidobacteria bacterium]|nr:hypothetical protein [Acidobacteriota bacterium]
MTVRRASLFSAVIAVLFGTFLQVVNVFELPAPAGALRVGEDSAARAVIESDLGAVPLAEGRGHDGQYAFVTARDPFAIDAEWNSTYVRYRHRRVGYPFLAGLGGLLHPEGIL